MSTGGGMLTSSSRPLQLRMRPDLVSTRARYQGARSWLVKDPVALRYFRFQDEEYTLLKLLDGQRSLDQIKDSFVAQFRPQKITIEELQRFVGHLHSSGLILSNNPGQGVQLLERARKIRRKKKLSFLANILFVQLPGIDPERILKWLLPKFKWIFTPFGVFGALALMLSALTLVVVNYDTFSTQPEFQQFSNFFNVYNVVWMWVALGVVKVIHEFGHGLTCTNFGGECHEMGMLFLVLTPCLYCNVSDSWMMPNKWHRIWISSAGIYVEVVLASICTFIWWNTAPGLLHNLCFSTMFVCSVSTVLFNANPLLRYDGYYILMDLLEIPNLRQKSTSLLQQTFAKWCLGIETPDDPFMPKSQSWLFVGYAIASYFYRWMVTFGILWFLYYFLGSLPEPWNKLRSFSWLLAAGSASTLIVMPAYQMYKFLSVPGRTREVKKVRVAVSSAVFLGVVAVALLIPFPLRIRCSLAVEPREARHVFIRTPGMLKALRVQPGQTVKAGDLLAELSSPDLDEKIEQARGDVNQQGSRVQLLKELQRPVELASAQESLNRVEAQLADLENRRKELMLLAPRDGIVIPPPYAPPPEPFEKLRTPGRWYGTPLEPYNLGAVLDEGLFCSISPPDQWDAVLAIDQADYEYVRKGQTVWMKLDELQDNTLEGDIQIIAKVEMRNAPQQLSNKAGGELPTEPGPGGVERPTQAFYQARVPLPAVSGSLCADFRGRAKIAAGSRTYGQWLWRWATNTFHFKL